MNDKDVEPVSPALLLYQSEDGRTRFQVRADGQTVWLTQAQMAELYQTTVPNINIHIRNILDDGELDPDSTIKDYLIVREEGARSVSREITHYNLDMILSVGYRVRSHRGTQFRRWATERLREYLIKGFSMDDERLRESRNLGADYFDELLERIRDIRASEKRFYQKVRDIYALSADYDPHAETTQEFFKVVQNKLHYAVSGHTAAELIADRADASRPNMGLTSWKGSKVRRTDVTIAKNYLNAEEVVELNRVVSMWLDYAEDQARRRSLVYMTDWREKLDGFLQFNDRAVLTHAGMISMEAAKDQACAEYERYRQERIEAEDTVAEEAFEEEVRRLTETPQLSDREAERRS